MPAVKTCTKCGETKPLDAFSRDRRRKDGRLARCKPCRHADHAASRKVYGYDKARYWKNPSGERERHLIRKYGVSLARYQEMLAEQGGACAICRRAQDRALDVDHNHATGVVRGLLCTNCNRMVGHAGDDAARLEAGAAYLRRVAP